LTERKKFAVREPGIVGRHVRVGDTRRGVPDLDVKGEYGRSGEEHEEAHEAEDDLLLPSLLHGFRG
jgi:hypothetical protein